MGLSPDLPHRTRRLFDDRLEEIDRKVVRLFALVTEAIGQATDALLSGDRAAGQATVDDDALVDELEKDVEDLAQREILRQSPLASDLRYLLSVLRVVPELERSGDLAEHIANRAITGLAGRLTPSVRGQLQEMGTTCVEIWRAAADAWAERDPDAAERIDLQDDHLDALHDALVDELAAGDLALADALQTTLVARFYERLGDHALHIAERIGYLAGA
jgi:phosphate transport system protein